MTTSQGKKRGGRSLPMMRSACTYLLYGAVLVATLQLTSLVLGAPVQGVGNANFIPFSLGNSLNLYFSLCSTLLYVLLFSYGGPIGPLRGEDTREAGRQVQLSEKD